MPTFYESVNLLEAAHERGMRLLFFSAEFSEFAQEKGHSEFLGRCNLHELIGLEERLADIPFIVASRFFELDKDATLQHITVESDFLLAITEYTLAKPDARRLCSEVDKAYEKANQRRGKADRLTARRSDLDHASTHQPSRAVVSGSFQFTR